jgi:hypothetical protein
MENLKIVFHFSTPVSLGFPWIFFDSLLAHIMLKEELGERYYLLPTKIPIKDIPKPPLKHYHDVPVASVSVLEPNPNLEMQVFSYFKRGDFLFPKGKIRRGSGFFKDFYLKAVYVPAQRAEFYATGELNEIKRLVSKVSALGKERNIGFGFVKKIEIKEISSEFGLMKDGLAMRPIPIKYLKYYEDSAYLAYKPPYWAKESVELCAVPFTKVEL